MDDLFSDPAEKARRDSERRADEDLSQPPSLIHDVFESEPPQARKRITVWLFVLIAIILTVGGSVFVYRSNSSATPAWENEPQPKLEMAEPPPVPPLRQPDAQKVSEEPAQEAPSIPKSTPQRTATPPPPARALPVNQQPEKANVVTPASVPKQSETKPEHKPKLLREPEDLAEEQRAFDLLREKSQAARQLLDGQLEQYRFLEYQVIPKEAGLYWVDLVAAQKDAARAVHFIWAVNPDKQTTKALSQAARDIDH